MTTGSLMQMGKSRLFRCAESGLGLHLFGYDCQISFPAHSHNELALVICTEGAVEMSQFGHQEVLRPGQMVFTNSCVSHASRYCVDGALTCGVTLEFDLSVLQHLGYDGASPYLSARFLGVMNLPEITRLAKMIQDESLSKERDSQLLMMALARQLLILALRRWPRTLIRRHESEKMALLPRNELLRTIELMSVMPFSDFAVESVARNLHRSTSAFSRLFSRSVGESPYQYFLSTIMERAVDRLAGTAEPVKEIALNLGFKNVAHFSEAFHRKQNMTPTAFRLSSAIPPKFAGGTS